MGRWFRFGETAFHTGWFVESLATQTLVLFVIRTAGRPWTNPPRAPLALTTAAIVLLGLALPHSPVATTLGLGALPPTFFVFLLFWRDPTEVFSRSVQPILWLLIFGQVFARTHATAPTANGIEVNRTRRLA